MCKSEIFAETINLVAEAAPVVEVIEEAPAKVVAAPASIAQKAYRDWETDRKSVV